MACSTARVGGVLAVADVVERGCARRPAEMSELSSAVVTRPMSTMNDEREHERDTLLVACWTARRHGVRTTIDIDLVVPFGSVTWSVTTVLVDVTAGHGCPASELTV